MVNIDELKGLPDVEFNFTVSGEVKTAFTNAASTLSGQRGTRAGWRSTALTDFDGHFKDVFTQNGTTQLNDLDEVARALKDVATKIGEVEEAARAENQRRKTAREWAQRQADRSGLEEAWDDFWGSGEDPPDTNITETGPATQVSAPRSVIQRGNDPRHFEITPKPGTNLTPDEYAELLSQIRTV